MAIEKYATSRSSEREHEWLWGWDPTPGIVSVWAEPDGRATVWRRAATGERASESRLVREQERFRPWVLLASLDDLRHVGGRLRPERDGPAPGCITYDELDAGGAGALRWLVRAEDGRALAASVLRGASRRLGVELGHLREIPDDSVLALPPEEQYLALSGRTYFRDLAFDDLRRLQFDLETTGLDPAFDRVFLAAIGAPDGSTETLEARGEGDAAEADLIARLVARIVELDPDVIENHNLHGFDLPFLAHRAGVLGVPLALGRDRAPALRRRPAARGARLANDAPENADAARGRQAAVDPMRRSRFTMAGRELIDTLDAVRRHDFSARDLPGHGLKAVARHLGLSGDEREIIAGARVHDVFRTDPERVRCYARADVREAAGVARLLGGAAFALARMAPRRYERLADAGAATGVLDPLLVRAYLRARTALPMREPSDGTEHTGAALHLFATGVAHRIVKADVASLYPSLMRSFRIGPRRDVLGALLAIVDQLVDQRLDAKAKGKAAPRGSPERHTHEATSAAMKLVVNSAYGYLAASSLTRFADVHAANEVTRHGRDVLGLLCRELAARGVTLLEADTDGVYFAVPEHFTEVDERRVVAEVGALLPPLVHLEHDGRYRAMLSHEPKNYALLPYGDGPLVLRGVAFRSSRAEPFGEAFLRRAIPRLLGGDVAGVRAEFVATLDALRRRELPTLAVASRVRLTKTPAQYAVSRLDKRELTYEALLSSGREHWRVGERIHVYRATGGRAALAVDPDADEADADASSPLADAGAGGADPRDYDVDHYARVLRATFAERLATALPPDDFREVFADPEQPSLFEARLEDARPILTVLTSP